MDDMMQFPNTVNEFMEEYKIVDTEQVYTNGAELVPVFRMKQWFDHIEGIPSAERRGRWNIELDKNRLFYECKCSVCGHIESFDPKFRFFNYCPNCGASMEGEQE